jgi:murein tripeptide amidase MpaA
MSQTTFYNCRTLSQTPAENTIFLVTITDPSVSKSKKNSIFVTGRVHPGETVSSFIMEGIINFLVSRDPLAQELRARFVFKLIPMLNPDGVIHGNYRANLAGIDLNRIWDSTDQSLSP